MRYLAILFIFVAFAVHSATVKPIGEQYAQCAGHYLTAGVITAIENDDENKIYYTLLALISSNRSYDLMGYDRAREITDRVIQKYGEMMEKRQDFMQPLVNNVEKCDKMVSKR